MTPLEEKAQPVISEAIKSGLSLDEFQRQMKRAFIRYGLDLLGGNQSALARELKIHRNTLAKALKET